MVSSAHPLATEAGLEILGKGGNAFDAAIAVASTLNVVEPQNSGMGGYGIILLYIADTGEVRVLNSSGRFPEATDSDVFREGDPDYLANRRGAKAISTPTNLNAWASLYDAYGSTEWKELLEPAISAAEDGHPINASVAGAIAGGYDRFSDYAKTVFGKDGAPLEEGDTLVQERLGQALRLVAGKRAKALYGGPIGDAIVDTVKDAGGFLRKDDLKHNEAEWWDPISMEYRGHTIYTASPPGNSFSSLLRMGLMERFDLSTFGHNTVEYLHLFAEVTKHAYWCRLKYAGDPDVKPPPLDLLLSDAYLDAQARSLNMVTATPFVPPGTTGAQGQHTTHFVVADRDGNIVSATQTLGSGFGSKVMVEKYGLWLNNSMYFCTFEPKGNPMDAHAGRRKLNSNHPTIIFRDGRPTIAIGTPGGHTIGQTVPQMVMNMLDFGMNVQEAIAAPRVAFTEPDNLSVETTFSDRIEKGLEARGHNVKTTNRIGNAHGLTIEYAPGGKPTRFTGAADPRGRGAAMGLN